MKELGELLELNGDSRTRFAPVVVKGESAKCRKEHTNSARAAPESLRGEREMRGIFPERRKPTDY